MTDKFQNKYRNASARAQWWDYGWNGAYFITICTKNREHYFGEIVNKKMVLSPLGVIADILWYEIPNHAPFVELGDFVVMPNHIHGILIIDKPVQTGHALSVQSPGQNINIIEINDNNENPENNINNENNENPVGGHMVGTGDMVGTGHALSLQPQPPSPGQNRYQNIGKNTVSSIIGSYKSAVTKHANRLGFQNGWQTRFHDHIIRNDAAYQRISNYIVSNLENWVNDKLNTDK